MNLSKPLRAVSRYFYALYLQYRTYLPRQKCLSFAPASDSRQEGIGPIFVINLDRQPGRWTNVRRELAGILDAENRPLSERAIRYSAIDAKADIHQWHDAREVEPFYTLGDQLFVDPQPLAVFEEVDLTRPIRMSLAEVAVARSHIGVWKAISQSDAAYTLVLEDDVWFERGFGRMVDQAWREMCGADQSNPAFDILYMSYREVRYGASKERVSKNVMRPERGLWYMSGYVLSKKGAQALLKLLPCRGPIDLWTNHQFQKLDVRALRRSVIQQRLDTSSTNSYSILPILNRMGVIDECDTALFHQRPIHFPVFAFGEPGSGLTSLAMALSMLGYSCCSDLDQIPKEEHERLIAGRAPSIFNAYVNIASLRPLVPLLIKRYPFAKFIWIGETTKELAGFNDQASKDFEGADLVHLKREDANTWARFCEHLNLPQPVDLYPNIQEKGQRSYQRLEVDPLSNRPAKQLQFDPSPWIVETSADWAGISVNEAKDLNSSKSHIRVEDNLVDVNSERWVLRKDTFSGNLGLFRPANVATRSGGGLSFTVKPELLGVRDLSAAAMSSHSSFLYGRFEITLQATSVSGLVTGFFLHRESPLQEIDIEIIGNHPDRLLVNVFYNPGGEGANFNFGDRGTPVVSPLGFDSSKALHQYAIEWDLGEIRWFVDGELVHRRVEWNPTPIPNLPMNLHINTWPARSRELAGRLTVRSLPVSSIVSRIAVNTLNVFK